MLGEIAKFVTSKDFNKFYKKYIKSSKSPKLKNKFNRRPKNVEVKRIRSIKKGKKSFYSSRDRSNYDETPRSNLASYGRESKETSKVKKKMAIKLVEFTCELLDIPALKRKYLSKKKRSKKKKKIEDVLRNSFNAHDNEEPIRGTKKYKAKSKIIAERLSNDDEDSPVIKIRKRVSNIRIAKNDKPVVTSAEEDSLSSSGNLSNLIIKMEVKDIKKKFEHNIKDDIKALDQKIMGYRGYGKYITNAAKGDNQLSNLKHF